MKRISALSLIAILMAVTMLLSSCSFGGVGTLKIREVLDTRTVYDGYVAPTSGTAVAELSDLSMKNYVGDLVYLRNSNDGYTRHVVYNLSTNTVVLDVTGNATTEYSISLGALYETTGIAIGFFTVSKGMKSEGTTVYTTNLYSGDGSVIATSEGKKSAAVEADLLLFHDALYGIREGQIVKLRDHSPLAAFPELEARVGDYYYAAGNGKYAYNVYDLQLNLTASVVLPSYAGDVAEPFFFECLNGELLYQYLIRLPDGATDYDALVQDYGDVFPVKIVTERVNLKNGKVRAEDTEYYFSYGIRLGAVNGIKKNAVAGCIEAIAIENGMIDINLDAGLRTPLFVGKDGDLKELAEVEGERVFRISYAADDRWVVYTVSRRMYLLNARGKILGEVTNASYIKSPYIICDGRIYDMDLNVLLDYSAKGLFYESAYGITLTFRNGDDELLTWNGSGDPSVLVPNNVEPFSLLTTADWGLILKNSETKKCIAYTWTGTQLFETSAEGNPYFATDVTTDEAILIRKTSNGNTTYFRLAK